MGAVLVRVRAELRGRWRATVGLALLLALAGGLALAAVAGARRTDSAYARFLRAINAGDAITVDGEDARVVGVSPVPEASVRALPQVAEMEPFDLYMAGVRRADGREITGVGEFAVVAQRPEAKLNRIRALSGRLPRPGAADEIVLGFRLAELKGVRVGERVRIEFFGADAFADFSAIDQARPHAVVDAIVVGTIAFPGAFPPNPDFLQYRVDPALAARAKLAPFFRGLPVRLRNGHQDVPAFKAALDRLAGGGELFFSQRDLQKTVERSIGVHVTSLWIFAAIAGVAALLIGAQTLARHLAAQATEHSTLQGLGMTRGQLTLIGWAHSGAAVIAGAIGAVALATLASPIAPIGTARVAEPDPGLRFDALALIGGAAVMTVVLGIIGGLLSLRIAQSRSRPAAVRDAGTRPSAVADRMARWGLSAAAIAGVRLALQRGRGEAATPARSAAAGTAVALAAMIGTLSFGSSLQYLLDQPRLYGWNWSAAYGNPYVPGAGTAVEPRLKAERRVAAYAAGSMLTSVSIEGSAGRSRTATAFALDQRSGVVHPTLVDGEWPTDADEVALGTRVMREVGAKLGDVVKVSVGDRASRMEVVGRPVFASMNNDTFAELGDGVGITFAGFRRLVPDADANTFFVRYAVDADAKAVTAALTKALGPGLVLLTEPVRPGDLADASRVQGLPAILAALLGVLASATLAHALLSSVRRRRRELAILKTLGFTRRELAAAVRWQALTFAAGAALIGAPLGVLVGRWAWQTFANGLGVVSVPRISIATVALLVAGVGVLATLIAIGPGRAAARTPVAAALRRPE